MTDQDAHTFAQRLVVLAEVLGEPLSPTRIAGYRAAVDDLPVSDLVAALNDCARTCKFFPKPVEIRLRVGALQDMREMRAYAERKALDDAAAVAQLPAHDPPHQPAPMTPEERAEREAKNEAGWQALFAKAKELAERKAMPAAREEPNTVIQIRHWREDRTA